MWVKICANTNLEDALLAVKLGADALGFVFAPSRRQVNVETVAAITRHLPAGVERIGVFPELRAAEIAAMFRGAGLTGVQIHGRVDIALLGELRALVGPEVQIIQTVHWPVESGDEAAPAVKVQLERIAESGLVERVLIDSKVGAALGGTGVTFDWAAARAAFAEASKDLRLILAGGLRPENVAEAIDELAPWGVDVASGVESEPGRKSAARLAAFLSAARAHAL